MRRRRAALALVVLVVPAAAHAAAAKAPTVVRDADDDVSAKALDVSRVSFGRSPDGRLRASVTMKAAWSPRDLLGHAGGPPGSVCLRLWTGSHRPSSTVPDYLVCATVASDNDALKASVLEEREGQLPAASASASASKPSARTVVVRFGQSAIGRPSAVRFGVEARPAGCNRVDCVDTAPDAPKSARLAIR
jgi:hypothetical protein